VHGKYKILFSVAAPVVGGTVTTQDVANWKASAKQDTGKILDLRELVGVQPVFENFWIDESKDVLQVTTPNNVFILKPDVPLILTLTAKKGAVYQWMLNGNVVEPNPGDSYTFSSKAVGKHEVSAFVKYAPFTGSAEKLYNQAFKIQVLDND